jgi:CRP/FNR family cyclic AMP-dependent transcriptional regulator
MGDPTQTPARDPGGVDAARAWEVGIAWLDALAPGERQRATESLRFVAADAGASVCRQGVPPVGWLGVLDGLVRVACTDESGRTTTITGVGAGGWFGEGTLLKHEPYRFQADALRPSRLAILPPCMFDELLARSVAFNRIVLDQLNERPSQFVSSREWERLRPAARVARHLAQLCNPVLYPRSGLVVKLRQQELADLAGLSRQCVNGALSQLQDRGILRVEYGGLRIRDLAAIGSAVDAAGE